MAGTPKGVRMYLVGAMAGLSVGVFGVFTSDLPLNSGGFIGACVAGGLFVAWACERFRDEPLESEIAASKIKLEATQLKIDAAQSKVDAAASKADAVEVRAEARVFAAQLAKDAAIKDANQKREQAEARANDLSAELLEWREKSAENEAKLTRLAWAERAVKTLSDHLDSVHHEKVERWGGDVGFVKVVPKEKPHDP